MLLHLNNEDFKNEVKEGIVIVDFYATWCGPCKMLSPVLEEVSDTFKVIKVDVDKHEDLAKEFGIMSVPTIMIYKDGNIEKSLVGFMPKDALLSEINNIK